MSRVNVLLVGSVSGLQGLDANLISVATVEEAVQRVANQDFAAIVLDVQGGIDFKKAQVLRGQEYNQHTPIIFIINFENLKSFQDGAGENADYLLKPVVPKLLQSKLGVLIDLYSKTEELKRLRHEVTWQEKEARPDDAAERRMDFLVPASAILGSSLDYETTLANVARLAVPTFADWCSVDMLGDDGVIRRLAVAHKDPSKVEWAYEMQRRYPTDPNSNSGMYRIVRTGQPVFLPNITDEWLVAATRGEEQLKLARELGFTSSMSVPLIARGRTLGVFSMTSTESGYHFNEDDLEFAQELANRAALAVDNARLYRDANKQREYLQVTLASIGDAVIATDDQGCVTFMNPVAEALTGWTQAEAMGKQLTQVFDIVNETTRLPVETPVMKVIRHGNIVGLANHTVLLNKNGPETPIDDSGAPIRDSDGNIVGVILVFRDITERRRDENALRLAFEYHRNLEERLALLVEVSTDLLSTLELDTIFKKVLSVSSQVIESDAYAIWRYISAAEGWRIIASNGLSEEYQASMITSIQQTPPFDKPVAVEDIESEDMPFSRRDMYLAEGIRSLLVTPLYIHGQTPGTLVFYSRQPRHYDDIEMRIAMAYANMVAAAIGSADLYTEAAEALALRNEFLSIAAHELKTPVTSLRGYAQTISRQIDKNGVLDAENARKALATIDQQSVRLTRLVERLLDISRIEAGRFTLDPEPVELIQIVEDVVSLRRTATTKHNIIVSAPQKLIVRCDPLRIEQVLTNLIDNAIKFSPDSDTVNVDISNGNGKTVQVAITDKGMGIPLEKREHLFKQFYQAHDQGFLGGLGLGLYISHEIIRLHGGTLNAEYPAEGGTRFIFTLPLA